MVQMLYGVLTLHVRNGIVMVVTVQELQSNQKNVLQNVEVILLTLVVKKNYSQIIQFQIARKELDLHLTLEPVNTILPGGRPPSPAHANAAAAAE